MRKGIIFLMALGLCGAGCSSEPVAPSAVPEPDPVTATPEYWLAKPSAAAVGGDNYDVLWNACATVAKGEYFTLDREDYREGILTTRPMVSKQLWEFWRSDAGDLYYAAQDSVQTIRRTIRFEFDREPNGCTVTPKVLIERLAQPNKRITSSAEYRKFFRVPENRSPLDTTTDDYWFSIGRDYAMEAELTQAIQTQLTGKAQ
jgi:hypothetical protein